MNSASLSPSAARHPTSRRLIAALLAVLQVLPATLPLAAHAQQTPPGPTLGQTVLNYDAEGNLTKIITPDERVTEQQFDNLNRNKKQILPPPSEGASKPEVKFAYDGQGRLKSVTDARNNVTQYQYTGLDSVTQTSPDTGVTSTEMTETGQLSYRLNARGQDASVAYDALMRPTYVYTPWGYTRLLYDHFSTTPGSENYGRGRLTQLVEYTNSVVQSRVMMFYDPLGRVSKRCQIWGTASVCKTAAELQYLSAGDALQYRWGPSSGADAGRLLGLTYPSGRKVDYQYDALGRISGITTTAPGTTTQPVPVVRNVQYSPQAVDQGAYGVTGFAFGATGGTQSYVREYDTQGRTSIFTLGKGSVTNASYGTHSVEYDAADRIIGISRFTGSWSDATFEYDGLDRLTNMSLNGGSLYDYDYDANGNRTLKVAGGIDTVYAHPSTSNRLSSTKEGNAASLLVTTDDTGNITRDPNTTAGDVQFGYDDLMASPYGRLTTSKGPGGRYTYQHNYLGQRIAKRGYSYTPPGGTAIPPLPYIGSTATLFHYDLDGKLIAEIDEATRQVKREYIWLGTQPVAVIAGTTPTQLVSLDSAGSNPPAVYYIHTDHLNTPRMVTDDQKKRRWDWPILNNEPFGATAPNEAPQAQTESQRFVLNLRFPGQYLDKETGTFYNYHRTYNPASGRYLQSDPIGLAGGLNTYAYAGSQPTAFTDPSGLQVAQIIQQAVRTLGPVIAGGLLIEATRPKDMTRLEERQFDRVCSKSDDPCRSIKDETNKAIDAALPKVQNMQNDPGGMFGGPGWATHRTDLLGRIAQINALISLGQKMGCDMSPEIVRAGQVYVPTMPNPK